MKDKDSFAQTQYISMYVRGVLASLFIGVILFFKYGWIGLIIALLLSFLLPFPAMYATGRIADFFVFLYNGGSRPSTLKERLAGDVDKIRILKREEHFREALAQADLVLARDPEHSEALLLKAEILFQGFEQYSAANACLNKIIAMEPIPDEKLLQWAISLREEILKKIRKRAEKHA
ncbi:MAG: hypothetical protein D3924_11435 [Candidatus Electrothrix sp. AR4]|nr:hypothetical protein [Candidatus Electrothrix sp. AR4]